MVWQRSVSRGTQLRLVLLTVMGKLRLRFITTWPHRSTKEL